MNVKRLGAIFSLSRALVWRAIRESGWRVLAAASSFLAIMAFTYWTTSNDVDVLTGITRSAVELEASKFFSQLETNKGVILAMFLIQGPYIAGLVASISGYAVAVALFDGSADRGGLEALLALPLSAKEIFLSMMISSNIIAFINAIVFDIVGFGSALTVMRAVEPTAKWREFAFGFQYLVAVLGLPLLMSGLSILITIAISVYYPPRPGAGRYSSGSRRGLAIIPGVALLLVASAAPNTDPLVLALAATLGLAITGTVVAAMAYRRFRPEFFLPSH